MNKKQLRQRLENQHKQAIDTMNGLLEINVAPATIQFRELKWASGCMDFDREKKPIQMSIVLDISNLEGIKSLYELQVTNLHETGHYMHFTANPNHLERYLRIADEARNAQIQGA